MSTDDHVVWTDPDSRRRLVVRTNRETSQFSIGWQVNKAMFRDDPPEWGEPLNQADRQTVVLELPCMPALTKVLQEQFQPLQSSLKRAPVQADFRLRKPPGTITWAEFLDAYKAYRHRYGDAMSAEQLCDRGGMDYGELVYFLGHPPKTWLPG